VILEFVFSAVFTIVKLILSVLPNVPAMSTTLTDYINQGLVYIVEPVGLVSYVLSSSLMIFGLGALLLAFNFHFLYSFTMWVVRKLPWSVH
jgi:hypothetical protein